jgi:DNA-binding phage protein
MSESGWGLTNERLVEIWDYLEELWEEGQVQYIAKLKGLLKRAQQMDPVEEGTGTGLSAEELCILTGAVGPNSIRSSR